MIEILALALSSINIPNDWVPTESQPISVLPAKSFCVSNDGRKIYSDSGQEYDVKTGVRRDLRLFSRAQNGTKQIEIILSPSHAAPLEETSGPNPIHWQEQGISSVFYASNGLLGIEPASLTIMGLQRTPGFLKIDGKPVQLSGLLTKINWAFPNGKPSYDFENYVNVTSYDRRTLYVFFPTRPLRIHVSSAFTRVWPIVNSVLPSMKMAFLLARTKSGAANFAWVDLSTGRSNELRVARLDQTWLSHLVSKPMQLSDHTIWAPFKKFGGGPRGGAAQTQSFEINALKHRARLWDHIIVRGASANGRYIVYSRTDRTANGHERQFPIGGSGQVWVAHVVG